MLFSCHRKRVARTIVRRPDHQCPHEQTPQQPTLTHMNFFPAFYTIGAEQFAVVSALRFVAGCSLSELVFPDATPIH